MKFSDIEYQQAWREGLRQERIMEQLLRLPGGDTQPQTQLQFFLNFIEFGMTVQQALEQPTVISNSFRNSYHPHNVEGLLLTPVMLPDLVRTDLAQLGHKLDLRDVKGVGSVKAIAIHPKTGVLMGGVSPSGDSYVMGW